MLAYALLALFKRAWSPNKTHRRKTSGASSTKSRLRRKSIKDLSIHDNASFDPVYLEPKDAVKLIYLCQAWSGAATEAFYEIPPLHGQDCFAKLTALVTAKRTVHPYALFIRELILAGEVADDLMVGDLKDCLAVCTNLISFRVEGCSHLSNLLAQFIGEHAQFLFRLELPGCSISDNFVGTLMAGGCNSLRHLDLSYTSVSLATMPFIIREFKFLETLDMTGAKSPTSHFDYTTTEDTDEEYPQRLGMKRISFSSTEITDPMVGYVTQCCHALECLLLDGCPFITDSAVSFVGKHCAQIQVLGLSYCPSITDAALQSLAVLLSQHAEPTQAPAPRRSGAMYRSLQEYRQVPPQVTLVNLQELYLSGCYRITQAGVCILAEKCPKLEHIVLDGCDRVLGWFFDPVQALGSPTKVVKVQETLQNLSFEEVEMDDDLEPQRHA
ncbi:hypothetical protein EDD86DRAFT_246394 [Gorgonomyces haynaldii]|nr:hypothetical protein EDD86DRAFT_246394 [Gorgonomyces haynaldii]